ncbi:(d)CMP kinase [Ruicaihuangia caeni]|uniref:Cytidylate kinase n=1 Tax=Ruicaihuangia caeni TaxID=3042517 RepID=A0AAW6TB59_9MICO|nr:(d)CMP kinase [Klugiella sp. YN-L-19]MDI2098327.1 (d)CMP kinase [Klugiella sp. YN-L-19]
MIVAIDGPAGSGKSSVSKAAARELGFAYQDTGAAYRAFAWYCVEQGVDLHNPDDVTDAVPGFDYAIGTDPDRYYVRVGRHDVTDDIREPRISAVVSAIARVPAVRERLTAIFREIMASTERPGIITEGRDITTVVAPEAPARILLTADEDVRMSRRSAELAGTQPEHLVAEQLGARDRLDSQVVDFMSAADGVVTIDSTHLTFDETVRAVTDLVRATMATDRN